MNLIEFGEYFQEQIKLTEASEDVTAREAFALNFTDILRDGEEFEEFVYLPYEGLGQTKKIIQIDGYTYEELDDTLVLFIIPPLLNFDSNITSTDAKKYFDRAQSLLVEQEYLYKNVEKSSEIYGLLSDLKDMYKNVSKYRIYLLTDMNMSKQIRVFENDNINGKPIEYHLWDIGRLHELYESGNIKEDLVIDFKKMNHLGIPSLLANQTEEYTSYLCNMPGIILSDIYNEYGSRLLEGNVRSFLQTKGKVNKGIRNSIINTPKMFFAYNNGIAATATDCEVENINGATYIIKLKGLQIVNGGQTTASIASAYVNDKREGAHEKIKDIYVPMKLSIVDFEKAREIIPRIAEYANTQNKVSASDLRSTHPYHIRIEEASRRIIAPATNGMQTGTKWFYERANGQYAQETYKSSASERRKFLLSNPKKQLIKKTTLAKNINIHEQRPHLASAGGEKSFIKFHEEVSAQWEKDNLQFNDDYFRRIVAISILIQETDSIVKEQEWFKGSYKANIVAYTVSKLQNLIKTNLIGRVLPYKKIWLTQSIPLAIRNQIALIANEMYLILIGDRDIENVTEWAKRENCWNKAKSVYISPSADFIRELDYLDDFKVEKHEAKLERKLMDGIEMQSFVIEFGEDGWKSLYNWGVTRNFLNPKEIEFIRLGFNMSGLKLPSEKQAKIMIDILEKMRLEGYDK